MLNELLIKRIKSIKNRRLTDRLNFKIYGISQDRESQTERGARARERKAEGGRGRGGGEGAGETWSKSIGFRF